ncbi:NAD(P)H dehydrogenase (quinone) [Pseudonocardia eucalypti]|nr:NAD(P)H dehydrogenase (quinone) [Pseudonocardia eucalypti]
MIVIVGATGNLGRQVVQKLLARGVPADRVVAAVRRPEAAQELGVPVRRADYDHPETLPAALAGARRVLLISSPGPFGQRPAQHRAVLEAAGDVELFAYTSILGGERSGARLAEDHQATEAAIRASGLPHVFLRNGWYLENYRPSLAHAATSGGVSVGRQTGRPTQPAGSAGEIVGSAGPDARVASALIEEYAEATAAVLTAEAPKPVYELSGDVAWSFAELAAEVARQAGRPVGYRRLTPAEHLGVLTGAGIPEPVADLLVDVDAAVDRGELATKTGDLAALIGRPTAPLAEAVKRVLAS